MAYPINKKLQMQKFASCDIGYCVILNKGMQLSLFVFVTVIIMPYRANILRNAYIVYIHPILVIEVQGHYFLDVKLLNFLIEGQCDIMI